MFAVLDYNHIILASVLRFFFSGDGEVKIESNITLKSMFSQHLRNIYADSGEGLNLCVCLGGGEGGLITVSFG